MIKAKVKRLFFHYKHPTFDDSKLPTEFVELTLI